MAHTTNGNRPRRDRRASEKIIELIAAGVVTPGEIAERLGKPTQTVHTNLSQMVKRGDVIRIQMGTYAVPNGRPNGVGPPSETSRDLVRRNGVEVDLNPETRIVTRDLKNRLRTNARIADALDGLFPGGVRNVETRSLVDWIDITRELIS